MKKYILILITFLFSECPDNFIESNQSTAENTVCYPEFFEHVISTQQAGYFFTQIDIEGDFIDNDDWIGAFNGDVCVGATMWDLNACNNNVCSIVVYGFDGNSFAEGYMMPGQIPTFKIYDYSENIYYNANASSQETWYNFQVVFINQLTTQIFGCNDPEACNFDSNADLNDGTCEYDSDNDGSCDSEDICPGLDDFLDTDGDQIVDCMEVFGCTDSLADNFNIDATENDFSCIYTYEIDSHIGANLLSYYVLPSSDNLYSSVDFINSFYSTNNLNGIIGENSSIVYNPNNILVGSLVNISRSEGYWVKMDASDMITLTGYPTSSNLQYSLSQGANLISFPSDMTYGVEDALPESLDGVVTSILSEGESAIYVDEAWAGSLSEFEGFKGYWFISNAAVDFQFDLDAGALARAIYKPKQYLAGYEYNQSTMQSFYYVKEVPMAELGDWIIAYNDDVVVGAREWTGSMTDVPVMGYDGDEYSLGYIQQDECPEFKLYKSSTGQLIDLYSDGHMPCFANNTTPILSRLLDTQDEVANSVVLKGAYPNPFNPVTNIQFNVENLDFVKISVYDIQGRKVQEIVNANFNPGEYEVMFNANNLSSGLYFVKLESKNNIQNKKILLLK